MNSTISVKTESTQEHNEQEHL